MIHISEHEKESCCGCCACAQACPVNCISMIEDAEGFKYPKVDEEMCIHCGLCERVCPILKKKNKSEENSYQAKAFGGWHKDDEVRKDSSSGGVFTLFSEYVLQNGGIVYGCGMNEAMEAVHMSAECVEDLRKLRGSKYVQSDIGNVFREIKEQLESGRYVLFIGTPCQAAGLSSFLQKEYDKLFVCDFICHGVPSPLVFKKYIQYLEEKNGSKVVSFRFRNKDKKWSSSGQQMGTAITFENGKMQKNMPAYKDYYMNAFLDDVCLRPSCYACGFKEMPKDYADITIADFWGAKKVDESLCDGKGTSLVLVHSKKGEKLVEEVKECFSFKEYGVEESIRRNQSLINSVPMNPNRTEFFKDMNKFSFEKLAKKYMTAFTWARHKAIKVLKKKLKGA